MKATHVRVVEEVVSVKRLTTALITLTLTTALAAVTLSMTIRSAPQLRTTLAQALIALSMAGLVLLAAFGSRRRGTETVGEGREPSSRRAKAVCTFSDVAAN